MKKDNIFVRSFKDGKFCTVLRKDVREINSDCPPKADASLKPALDAALAFQQQFVVPSAWKTEVKEESSSSEDDEDEEEEEQEEDASGGEEEEEVEPFPEERENFLQQLYKFMEDRGTQINKRPVLGYRNLNLFKLYRLVNKLGGFDNIESGSVWKQVYQDLGIPVLNSAAGYNVKCAYRKYLYGFEEYCTSTAITFRMDLPLKQAPRGEAKPEAGAARPAVASADPEERAGPPDGEPRSAQAAVCKEEKPISTRCKTEPELLKSDSRTEDEGQIKGDADEGSSTAALRTEGVKQEREDDDEEPDSKDISGYDEWVKADKIVRPANKNVQKVKHRKKIKNKAERERERQERLADREGLVGPAANSTRVPRSKCGLSQDVFSKMDEASELSTDDSDREDDGGSEHMEQDHHGCRGSSPRKATAESPGAAERWESRALPPSEVEKNQEAAGGDNVEVGKRRVHAEQDGETTPAARKRKSESAAAERTPKSQSKAKTRNSRNADWLPGASPRKMERAAPSSASSDDDSAVAAAAAGPQGEEGGGGSERNRSKTRGTPPSKKYNGVKEKSKAARQAAFWEVPEKRPKVSGGAGGGGEEQKAAVRPKGQKDVWSSIQAQWPKKTLKELFSDSDTEAANSPPPPPPPPATSSCPEEEDDDDEEGVGLEDVRGRPHPEDEEVPSEGPGESDKLQEFPSSSGSNSVLNTPPTTPESPPAGGAGAGRSSAEDSAQQLRPSPPHNQPPPAPAVNPSLCSEGQADALLPLPPPTPLGASREEAAGSRSSETDSSTVEVESLGGELQELPLSSRDDGAASPSKAFDVGLSCSSSSCGCSHELSGSSQQESEPKSRVSASQKRQKESQTGGASKKHKPNRKSLAVPPKKNQKAANSSDSEDQSMVEGAAKSAVSKSGAPDAKVAASPKCHGRSPPSSHKYHKQGDTDHSQHRDNHARSPRVYKWSFQMSDLEKMNSLERISFLQEKLQDIRNHYLSLKSEVASIDRRRKRMKKKERESTVAASSSSSSSSSPSSSSLTAAVMLTLADPPVSSSSSSSQNSGVSVECR